MSGSCRIRRPKLVSQRTRDLELDSRNNNFWLNRLAVSHERGDDPREILILHELTKRVTSDDIRLAARKYLRDDQYIDARLLPKTEPGAAPPPHPHPHLLPRPRSPRREPRLRAAAPSCAQAAAAVGWLRAIRGAGRGAVPAPEG